MAEYINPRVDWAFKRIFGSDDTKECLITFLNGVFEDEFVIKDVKHLKTEQTRHQKRERGVIFDVACETSDGRHVIVEMQKKEQRYFVDRALYYSSKAIVEQAPAWRVGFPPDTSLYRVPHGLHRRDRHPLPIQNRHRLRIARRGRIIRQSCSWAFRRRNE